MSMELLGQAVAAGELRLFDVQFAKQIVACNDSAHSDESGALLLAAALASYRLSRGDTCVDLEQVSGFGIFSNKEIDRRVRKIPRADRWREYLLAQPVVRSAPDMATSDPAGEIAPLILDQHNRLYLARYWHYERAMLESISDLIASPVPPVDKALLTHTLERLYAPTTRIDWQKVATAVAALRRFCVITGGPGTGKTYTVAALLAVFEALAGDNDVPEVMLAAPTGKAATRLTESLLSSDVVPACYRDIEALTLHRLLKMTPGRLQPGHHRDNPLRADVLVVDEASMIDLPMMTRILDAVPSQCRLILLGDKDQLASVESGMVLGDICGPQSSTQLSRDTCEMLAVSAGVEVTPSQEQSNRLSDHIVYLTKSHRSGDSSGINELANAINCGNVADSMEFLQSSEFPTLQLLPHDMASIDSVINDQVVSTYRQVVDSKDPAVAIEVLSGLCVLCALRRGSSGAEGVNRRIEQTLKTLNIIQADTAHYPGRPVMVTENSVAQNLFNGDIGITMHHEGKLKVFFQGQSSLRAFVPGRLPQHQTFYAMTVHKSQGSEYSTVVVVLPDGDSPLLTRELLYTAVTRARERVIVVANHAQLETAIHTRSKRQSGILTKLWPPEQPQRKLSPRPASNSPPVQTELDF